MLTLTKIKIPFQNVFKRFLQTDKLPKASIKSFREIVTLENVEETVAIVKGTPLKRQIEITTITSMYGDKTELARQLMKEIPKLGKVYRYSESSISFRSNSTKEIVGWLENSKDIYFKQ